MPQERRVDPTRKIQKWEDLALVDLFHAYRKAKADCYFERFVNISEPFAQYESNIVENLQVLLKGLREGKAAELLRSGLGQPAVVAKKLSSVPYNKKSRGHGFFSDPKRAIINLNSTHESTPEFRLIGDFSVTTHIVSALWINTAGHRFDACLDDSAYGSRLRRFKAPDGSGDFHINALGSFEPYYAPYRRWRSGSLDAAKSELEQDRTVIAVSLDLKSFYHNIDPHCFTLPDFQAQIGVSLNVWERDFTVALCDAMDSWSKLVTTTIAGCAPKKSSQGTLAHGGVPIGLAAARVLANVLLAKWDRVVQEKLTPIYYGRYVDDILLVIHDAGNISGADGLFKFMMERLGSHLEKVPLNRGEYRISLGGEYQGGSKLHLQESKSKAFFLQGRAGLDLLDSIEMEIAAVASERRLMPDLEDLDRSRAARVLSAAGSVAEEADTLRRADGLSVRRLGWSIQLRQVETLARDLRPSDWKADRLRFYDFARHHILRADRVLDHLDHLPRLLSLAVSLEDWKQGLELVEYTLQSLSLLQQQQYKGAKLNGWTIAANPKDLWAQLRERTLHVCRDAFLRAYNGLVEEGSVLPGASLGLRKRLEFPHDDGALLKRIALLRISDWSREPYKSLISKRKNSWREFEPNENLMLELHWKPNDLVSFLQASKHSEDHGNRLSRVNGLGPSDTGSESWLPFLFPTRPYSAQEIAFFVPACVQVKPHEEAPTVLWARYVHAVRGAWIPVKYREHDQDLGASTPSGVQRAIDSAASDSVRFQVGGSSKRVKVRLGITSLLTTEESWAQGANGSPDLSPKRYKRINDLVNEAIRAKPRPTHLLLPELSLPGRWIRSVSARLLDAGISLIAGLDYMARGSQRRSEAALVLVDDRLGFRSSIQLRQTKSRPAPGEDYELQHKFGCTLAEDDLAKPIYHHFGFVFGVLICSELQSIHHRRHFQGKVDAMMVLSWNRDRETFSALVESAALDVHAYIALANNRQYGDSRVRSPAKDAFRRDLCLLRGGANDYIVVVEIDPLPLREFQSRSKPWPEPGDLFKPVPDGFKLDPPRREKPR